jgi:hypothetical protein
VGSGDVVFVYQSLEGLRIADLMLGTASAKSVTIQFGCRGPAGTYCVAIRNATAARSYAAEFTISAGEANTDVVKSASIALDTTGTWPKDNTAGAVVSWTLMCGATFQTSAHTWAAGNFFATSNQFNFMGTNGNVFELFDVSLTVGTTAPAFLVPDYAETLRACQRYWEKSFPYSVAPADNVRVDTWAGFAAATNQIVSQKIRYAIQKRSTPTLTFYSSNNGVPTAGQWQVFNVSWLNGSSTAVNAGDNSDTAFAVFTSATATTSGGYILAGGWKADARL